MTRLSAFEGIEDQVLMNDKMQKDQNQKKLKRLLEQLSVTCSLLGMNLIIASFLGLTKAFGFTSPEMVFYSAFTFLLVSIASGTMAMLLSAPKYENIRSLIYSTLLLHTFFRWPQIQKNESSGKTSRKMCEVGEKSRPLFTRNPEINDATQTTPVNLRDTVSTDSIDLAFNKDVFKKNNSSPDLRSIHFGKAAYSMPSTQRTKVFKNSDDGGISTDFADFLPPKQKLKNSRDINQDESKYSTPKLDNKLPNTNSKNSLISRGSSEQNGIYHQPKSNSNSKTLLQLKRRGICLFGETSVMQSSNRVLKSSRFILYNVENSNGMTHCVPSKEERTYYAEVDMKSPEKVIYGRQMLSHRTHTEFPSYRNHNSQSIWRQNFPRNINSTEYYGEMPQDKVLEVASKLNQMNFLL